MADDVLVRVERVSKKFCRDLKKSLRYGLADAAADLFGGGGAGTLRDEEFWAVDDVSFELKRGDCLGLIGHNGAGKTTLLKMLNGLIRPDRGRIEIRGRVGALISLGAGFNPILTGRENVFINGSVLGLSKREIQEKLGTIIEFAEIGDFIDSPVQSYSSGMQVRLGFAVATALQPDVLLLDEVLAVGDVGFRAKCYERLAAIRERAGLLLVSHDTDQVARVCSHVLVLDHGCTRYLGDDVGRGIRLYQELSARQNRPVAQEHTSADASASVSWTARSVAPGGLLTFSISICLAEPVAVADVRVVLWSEDGLAALDAYSRTQGLSTSLQAGRSVIALAVGPLRLRSGRYTVTVAVLDRANNRHLYWGDRVHTVEAEGPVSAAVAYTPALTYVSITAADDGLPQLPGAH
jgi:lipopolysaccharide transport system ATP-binding protein